MVAMVPMEHTGLAVSHVAADTKHATENVTDLNHSTEGSPAKDPQARDDHAMSKNAQVCIYVLILT